MIIVYCIGAWIIIGACYAAAVEWAISKVDNPEEYKMIAEAPRSVLYITSMIGGPLFWIAGLVNIIRKRV